MIIKALSYGRAFTRKYTVSYLFLFRCQGLRTKFLIAFVALILPISGFTECYVIGDLKGYSTRQHEEYTISEDGISSSKFIIDINGEKSSVSHNDMNCMQAGKHTLLCVNQTPSGQSTIETWAIYPEKGKAIHTKSINGYDSLNGANLFVGSIKGRCD